MRIEILDKNGSNGWVLGKVALSDYISFLTLEKFNYDIQRGVVSNPYLDTILDAIVKNSPLPPISLVANINNNDNTIVDDFNILDGLQRTCRLWIYYQLSEIAIKHNTSDYKIVTEILKKDCDFYLQAVTPRQVRKLFERENQINVWNLKEFYSRYNLYLYIWYNLAAEDEIKTMLILNAGQKRMALPHQYELMYLRLFEKYTTNDTKIKLIRSKDSNNKKREVGEYRIPTIITGVQSLIAGKPIRLSRDMLYRESEREDTEYMTTVDIGSFFSKDFIDKYLSLLYELDCKLSTDEKSGAWFAKDTTISGIMAGIGSLIPRFSSPDVIIDKFQDAVSKMQNISIMNLAEYERAYQNLSSVRVNIGTVVRKAIASYINEFLTTTGNMANWERAFKMSLNN